MNSNFLVGALSLLLMPIFGYATDTEKAPPMIAAIIAAGGPKQTDYLFDNAGTLRTAAELQAKLPQGADCERLIDVSPSGRVACSAKTGQLGFWRLSSTEARQVTMPAGQRVNSVEWSGDGRYAFALALGTRVARLEGPERQPAASLIAVDFASGSERQYNLKNTPLHISPSPGGVLYYVAVDVFAMPYKTAIRRLDLVTGKDEQIYETPGINQGARVAVSPDGKLLAIAIDAATRYWSAFNSLIIVDAATGREVRNLTGTVAVNSGATYAWLPSGKELLFVAGTGGLNQVATVSLSGEIRFLTRDASDHTKLTLSPDKRAIAYTTFDLQGRRQIRTMALPESRGSQESVWKDYGPDPAAVAASEIASWTARDGRILHGFLFFPPGYTTSKRYPMLVDVHGGGRGASLGLVAPFTIGTARGPMEWHAWAAQGYVVFAPEFRSSGASGPLAPARTKCGLDDVEDDGLDVVDGIAAMVGRAVADPTRIGLIGHSAGGARVIRLLASQGKFAAAVVNEATAPDALFSYVGLAHKQSDEQSAAVRLSPDGVTVPRTDDCTENVLFSAYKSRTPSLVMIGNERLGSAANITGEVLYSVLKDNGVPSKLVRFPEDGHNYVSKASALHAFTEASNWFAMYLRPERSDGR